MTSSSGAAGGDSPAWAKTSTPSRNPAYPLGYMLLEVRQSATGFDNVAESGAIVELRYPQGYPDPEDYMQPEIDLPACAAAHRDGGLAGRPVTRGTRATA